MAPRNTTLGHENRKRGGKFARKSFLVRLSTLSIHIKIRSKYHTQLANMSLDEIVDLTANPGKRSGLGFTAYH